MALRRTSVGSVTHDISKCAPLAEVVNLVSQIRGHKSIDKQWRLLGAVTSFEE